MGFLLPVVLMLLETVVEGLQQLKHPEDCGAEEGDCGTKGVFAFAEGACGEKDILHQVLSFLTLWWMNQ